LIKSTTGASLSQPCSVSILRPSSPRDLIQFSQLFSIFNDVLSIITIDHFCSLSFVQFTGQVRVVAGWEEKGALQAVQDCSGQPSLAQRAGQARHLTAVLSPLPLTPSLSPTRSSRTITVRSAAGRPAVWRRSAARCRRCRSRRSRSATGSHSASSPSGR